MQQKKTSIITARMTPEDKQKIEQRAADVGMAVTDYLVQSFAEDDPITSQKAHAIGLELAQREFPGFEVVIATHMDTNHIHNHLVVNSVSCVNGKKLHQSADDLLVHRQANDEICLAHGLTVLDEPEKQSKKKRMKPGEYQASLRDDSWKMDLVQAINNVLEYAGSKDEFIEGMEYEGYQVTWMDTRQHITFTCPNGRRCRDSSLHDKTFLKENMEALFAYRETIGFQGEYAEPEIGWIGEAGYGLLRLGRELEDGSVDTTFADTSQTDSTWDREMLIEGRVFHVTSIFAGEATATPTEKLLALIDTELANESHSV